MSRVPDQFGDPTLSRDEAYAACGPAAAVAFAASYGRNPTLREALDLAKTVGWTPEGGMNGIGNQKRLLDSLGVPSRMDTNPSWDAIQKDAASGNPVTISTPKHYFVADDYDSKTGQYHVGQSGTALKAGKAWMTRQEIVAAGQGLNGALFVDNPTVTAPSVVSGGKMAEGAITPEKIQELARIHRGQPSRRVKPGTETRKLIIGGIDTGLTEENPDPTWILVFPNGKKIEAVGERGADGEPTGNIIGDGDALNVPTNTTPNTQLTWIRGADVQERGYTRNPKTGELEEAQMPDGSPAIRYPPPKEPRDPSLVDASRASAANAYSQIEDRNLSRPSEIGLRGSQQANYEATTAKTRQEMQGKLLTSLQQAEDTIQYIANEYTAGRLTVQDMAHYGDLVWRNVDASIRGTTIFDEWKETEKIKTERAGIGRDLINQRLTSGASLTNSILNTTVDAMTANKGMLVSPGSFNPLSYARERTDELSGGESMAKLAESLLQALEPSSAPSGAGAMGGGLSVPPELMTDGGPAMAGPSSEPQLVVPPELLPDEQAA